MKSLSLIVALILLSQTHAAEFNSGSNGTNGPLLVIEGELNLPLPPDGILHYTSIEVRQSGSVRFLKNELNTPAYLLATGDVVIHGALYLDGGSGSRFSGGAGGAGGFDGGNPPTGSEPPGDGLGPGGGAANLRSDIAASEVRSAATHASITEFSSTNRYGNAFLQPLVGGSGAGGTVAGGGGNFQAYGGGGGGGAILIAANGQIYMSRTGRISARSGGGGVQGQGGSGGAIRLVSPRISIQGTLDVSSSGGGGLGRIRVDTLDRSGLQFEALYGAYSVGRNMTAFNSPNPRLDFLEVGAMPIPSNASGPVTLTLPLDSPTNQTVKIRATGFVAPANLEVSIKPENGASRRFVTPLRFDAANPVTNTVEVVIPPGVPCHVEAWTR